jgi:hypothetical protein
MHIDGKRRWLTGIDRAISEHTTLMADYISGDENYSSIAVGHQWTEGFGITAGIQFPNGGGESLYTLHLVITGRIGGANHID